MMMTSEEIVRSYREAADKKKQLGILAELNDCNARDIRDVLKDAGIEHVDLRGVPRAEPAKKTPGIIPRRSKAESALAALKDQLKDFSAMRETLPGQIAELQRELDTLDDKIKTAEEAIALIELIV